MASQDKTFHEPPAHYDAMQRARFYGNDGAPLCERVANGSSARALDEASVRFARGEVDEALVWIERARPELYGLARAITRHAAADFGPPASKHGGNLGRAADALRTGDVVEAVACVAGARHEFARLPHLLNAARREA